MKDRKIYLLFFFFLAVFSGCEKEEFLPDEIPISAQRTVLVYLGVDNNFRPEAQQKIETLTTHWNANLDGNLLVYADTGERPVLIHIYRHAQKGNIADTIAIYPPENSANPATLTRTLNKIQTDFPANSYGLIVLSHATGWLPAEMSYPTPALRSIILDKSTDESNNYMELSDFAEAIPYKLDFIIFDACFMGSVEVAYELKDKTDYLVASAAEVISPGFVYASMMQHLFTPTPKGALGVIPDLTAVAREFYEYYNHQSGLYRSATVSVVKTSELENLRTVFQGIDDKNYNDLYGLQTFGYGMQKIYFDLGDYIQQLSPERYAAFQTALDKCVIYKANTPSYYSAGTETLQVIRTFSGMSVYIPQAVYPQANEVYKRLKWTSYHK